MISWSEEQNRVIETRNADILVSAAAGSGKTAVLVERIIRLICDEGMSFDELIVMTFTKAAAAEMRARIEKALYKRLAAEPDNTHIALQLNCISRARISTIDSICQTLVKQYYQYLDIDPGFRVADEGELAVMKSDIIDELLEEYYDEADDDFMKFADTFSRKTDDSGIKGLIDRLYTFAESQKFPEQYIEEQIAESTREINGCYEESRWYDFAVKKIHEVMRDYTELLNAALSVCDEADGPDKYAGFAEDCIDKAESICGAKSYEELRRRINEISFGRMPSIRKTDDVDPVKKNTVQAAINSFKDYVNKTLKGMFQLSPEELKAQAEGSAALGRQLLELTAEFMRRFDAAKREANIIDFSDMEHFAIKLLYEEKDGKYEPGRIADELALQLKEIMIDEYQDSNNVQEALLYALSAERFGRPDVFMVGDVKQSIYRFRQADPHIFINKYNSYSDSGNKILIELNANYRSRSEVLYSTNAVFDKAMRGDTGGVEYDENSRLNARASYPDNMTENADGELISACRTEMLIADTAKEVSDEDTVIADTSELYTEADATELKNRELEFTVIARRIKELVNEREPWKSFKIQDNGSMRGAKYGDIAVLVRKTQNGYADQLSEVLAANGIKSVYNKKTGFYSAPEVQLMLSLLDIIDNPHQDIPLAAVMRSPMFGFTDDELAVIRAKYDDYLSADDSKAIGAAAAPDEAADAAVREFTEAAQADITDEAADAAPDPRAEAIVRLKNAFSRDFWDAVRHAAAENAHAAAFTEAVDRLRDLAEVLPVHLLLERIYDETGFYDYVTAMPFGEIRRKNLDLLTGRAESYAGTGMHGLYNFTRYIEALKDNNRDESSSQSSDEDADCVKIVTIHGSKGLEYPIVFLAGCSDIDTDRSVREDILFDNELGIASDYTDIEHGIRYPGFKKAIIRMKNREEDIGENLRLLYVAMTRAKEKLIVCGRKQSSLSKGTAEEKTMQKAAEGSLLGRTCWKNDKLPKRMIMECSNYLDIMLLAAGEDGRAFDMKFYRRSELVNAAKEELMTEIGAIGRMNAVMLGLEGDADSDHAEALRRRLNGKYAFETETKLKPKLSVSEIKALGSGFAGGKKAADKPHPHGYDESSEYYADYDDISADYEAYDEAAADTAKLKDSLKLGKSDEDRVSNSAETECASSIDGFGTAGKNTGGQAAAAGSPANRGTAFHRAAELADYTLSPEENLQYLEKCGKMTDTELKLLDRAAFTEFMKSELAAHMAEAFREGRLRREQHFMAGIPARRLIESQDSDELQLLQGIIDAYITEPDDSITLIDYKTDRTSDAEELKSRYRLQLELYAEALEQLTGCPVKQKIIYSTFMKRQIML